MFINELFENDDMFAAKRPGKYYDSDRQPREYRVFWDQLIPASGKAETVEGEMLRAVSKIQHDFYNNGFGNNWSGALAYLQQYLPSFGVNIPHTLWNTISPYATGRTHPNNQKIENNIGLALDQITDGVMAAIRNSDGNYHPNQADMYDMSSPTQWSDDEDDYDEDDDDYEDDVYENADDMFASHLDRILSQFEFPEDGPLGYMLGGGVDDADFGRTTDGLTIVDRENKQIAFLPDFTYFEEEPTQDQLGELFYDDTPGYATERMPITSQIVQKVRSISEASFQFDLDDEPEPPKKTQTKDKPKFNHDPFQQQQDRPLANRQAEPQGGAAQPAAPRMRQATAANTRRAAGNVEPTDQMRDMLGRMRDIEIDPDLADYPADEPTLDISTEVNTENLPAVAGQAIAAAGESSPEFHQVARLPGNMSRMIRQLGKALFGSMTNTPTEDIYMIGNLGGQGPNTRMEVNAVANFVRENSNDMGPGDIDFDAVMPGYSAQTHQYEAAGIRWLLVKDFAGEYIYAWPEADSKNTSNTAQLSNEPKRIK
jgi:hypothetical protein